MRYGRERRMIRPTGIRITCNEHEFGRNVVALHVIVWHGGLEILDARNRKYRATVSIHETQ